MEPTPLLDGLRFAECPRWHDDRLWFCDMHARRIMTVDEHGHAETVVQFARGVTPAGLGFLPDGSLLVVNLERPVILRRAVDGAVTEYADLTSLAVGPLNDLAVDRHGRAYVGSSGTDGFDFEVRPPKGSGSVILVEADRSARIVAGEVDAPNGPVLTCDDTRYIVSLLFAGQLLGFDKRPDGSLHNRRIWADLKPGGADGITVDRENAIWTCEPMTGQIRRVREGGEITDMITVEGRMPIVPCLGGQDGRTLFILNLHGGPDALMNRTCTATIDTMRVVVPAW
ncbi:SMP-30/Gluconolaconase/LRE-like region-containing protein [Pseudonocardia dioxanivorans CB1190]|uniref:SMP-30/Gluconolaconase/LRE-like region-containing protein n=1 Tax=Pseudonocardia dioxanivorans (strain ATCC 55486 / DSM 44775 / JCM 13855 / CB1190) TaxID=675635 RepID=F4CPB8_PSEUX|nr:SMP-30/gluconolactonase/LRE family protein [Pseudonocardia dioxanivorans]AEA24033.1 SMP-30/Gluconolaconase/LRE-like region-containing protein [Pseudonocardia dioxanivorans CB1190]